MKQADETSHLILGRNPVYEALERGDADFEKLLIQKGLQGGFAEKVRTLARRRSVPVQVVPIQKLNRLADGGVHQGVIGIIAPVSYADLDEMLREIAPDREAVRSRKPCLLMFDQIEDPHNFGAMVRSAVAFAVAGIIVPDRHMAPLSATVIKASAGTALRIPIARTGNLRNAILQLKERGYWVAGASGDGTVSTYQMDWDRPLVIVIGNEGRGLRTQIRNVCDYVVSIPIQDTAESLNASVAVGILLYASLTKKGTTA